MNSKEGNNASVANTEPNKMVDGDCESKNLENLAQLCSSGAGWLRIGGGCGGVQASKLRAVLRMLDELGNRVLRKRVSGSLSFEGKCTYARHQLEYRVLCLLEE